MERRDIRDWRGTADPDVAMLYPGSRPTASKIFGEVQPTAVMNRHFWSAD
jgi:hypothetical protein